MARASVNWGLRVKRMLAASVYLAPLKRMIYYACHTYSHECNASVWCLSIQLFCLSSPDTQKWLTMGRHPTWLAQLGKLSIASLGSLNRVPALIGWRKGRNVTSARWQVSYNTMIPFPYGTWVLVVLSHVCELLYFVYFALRYCPSVPSIDKLVIIMLSVHQMLTNCCLYFQRELQCIHDNILYQYV